MILEIDGWELDVDITRTMEHSAAEAAEHCTCAYCRNFYAAVDAHYPNLRLFLVRFGLDIEAPDEQLPYDYQGQMYYDSAYLVAGRILRQGQTPILIDNSPILPVVGKGPFQSLSVVHDFPAPFFVLDVRNVVLPWVLNEPLEETLSPANEPSFLKKMWDRLLFWMKKGDSCS